MCGASVFQDQKKTKTKQANKKKHNPKKLSNQKAIKKHNMEEKSSLK